MKHNVYKIVHLYVTCGDERAHVSEVCPCPRFSDMPVSEVVSVFEVMTLSESMSASESESEVKNPPGSPRPNSFPKLKCCVRVRVCFGHGLGHELMSEVVSVHFW